MERSVNVWSIYTKYVIEMKGEAMATAMEELLSVMVEYV